MTTTNSSNNECKCGRSLEAGENLCPACKEDIKDSLKKGAAGLFSLLFAIVGIAFSSGRKS